MIRIVIRLDAESWGNLRFWGSLALVVPGRDFAWNSGRWRICLLGTCIAFTGKLSTSVTFPGPWIEEIGMNRLIGED